MLPVRQQRVIMLNWWGFCFGLVVELNEGQRFPELSSTALKSLTDLPQITSSPPLRWDQAAKSWSEQKWWFFIDFTACVKYKSSGRRHDSSMWVCVCMLYLLAFLLNFEMGKDMQTDIDVFTFFSRRCGTFTKSNLAFVSGQTHICV